MYIVGIHDGHNASVALMKKGKLIFALQEERISKEKNASGFPIKAYSFMLEYFNITESEIKKYMISSNHMIIDKNMSTRDKMLNRHLDNKSFKRKMKNLLRNTSLYQVWQKKLKSKKIAMYKEAGIDINKIEFVEHHKCHINTAYYASDYTNQDKVLVITADGGGDKLAATVSLAENGKIKRQFNIPDTDSLGYIYSSVTWHMGMVPNEHEYKIMGLAPYAKPEEIKKLKKEFYKILNFNGDELIWKRQSKITTFELGKKFDKIFTRQRFDIIAGATQEFTEELLVELVKRNLKHFNVTKVALSGGVFMNVKANQKISEIEGLDNLFIMPSCGDETNAIGAAYEYYTENKSKDELDSLGDNFCIGPKLLNDEVGLELEKYKNEYKIEYYENIEQVIAKLLAENNVVARVNGELEFGARSLGHRSILSNPSSFENVKIINEMIKKRDFWMPFAGSYLYETKDKYIINPKNIEAPYMILTFDTYKNKQNTIEGAIHPFDKTTRPQVVKKHVDLKYWNLINEFKKITNIGCVLNTSFNLHGLPVAYDVKDSMHVMKNSGLKYLAIENYLVTKMD